MKLALVAHLMHFPAAGTGQVVFLFLMISDRLLQSMVLVFVVARPARRCYALLRNVSRQLFVVIIVVDVPRVP